MNPPEHLAHSADTWRQIVRTYQLDNQPALRTIVTKACEQLEVAAVARAAIDEHGVLIPTDRHGLKSNPAIAVERLAVECFTRLVKSLPHTTGD